MAEARTSCCRWSCPSKPSRPLKSRRKSSGWPRRARRCAPTGPARRRRGCRHEGPVASTDRCRRGAGCRRASAAGAAAAATSNRSSDGRSTAEGARGSSAAHARGVDVVRDDVQHHGAEEDEGERLVEEVPVAEEPLGAGRASPAAARARRAAGPPARTGAPRHGRPDRRRRRWRRWACARRHGARARAPGARAARVQVLAHELRQASCAPVAASGASAPRAPR